MGVALPIHINTMNIRTIARISYHAFYWILLICLLGLLIITPADAIRQALNNKQLYNVFVVGGCYVLTFLLALLIWVSRKWTNRSVLAAIPKTWIPIEKGDVNKKVRKMIVGSLTRSAAIAWDSRPRIDQTPPTIVSGPSARDHIVKPVGSEDDKKKERTILRKRRTQVEKDEEMVVIPPKEPMWGAVSHNGWASPLSLDLPNVQYITVILELPHLIEAKAVSMAPSDPDSTSKPPTPDIRAVEVLQRPATMGFRDYINYLMSIEAIASQQKALDFLLAYEHARFSSEALSETQFRDLMSQFSEVLRSIQPISPATLATLAIGSIESDVDDDNSSSTTPVTPISQRSRSLVSTPHSDSTRSGSEGTIRTAPSRRLGTSMASSMRLPGYTTAPATPGSRHRVVSRTPSANTFAHSRMPYAGSSGGSTTSLNSSQGSVIRLSPTNDDGYVFTIPGFE